MNRKNKYVFVVLLSLILVLATACGKEEKKEETNGNGADESWAYGYDSANEILRLNADGSAVYKVKTYKNNVQIMETKNFSSYKKDDSYITLTDKEGTELKLRYKKTDKGITVYEKTVYEYSKNNVNAQDGLLGLWVNPDQEKICYEFTDKGTFLEDSIFPGHFYVKEAEGEITLEYNDPVPNTVMYYSLENGKLIIEYPWDMVATGSVKSGS